MALSGSAVLYIFMRYSSSCEEIGTFYDSRRFSGARTVTYWRYIAIILGIFLLSFSVEFYAHKQVFGRLIFTFGSTEI